MGTHNNMIAAEALSVVVASTSLVKEIIVCDLWQTCTVRGNAVYSSEALSVVAASAGLVKEIAVCDLYQACTVRGDAVHNYCKQPQLDADTHMEVAKRRSSRGETK